MEFRAPAAAAATNRRNLVSLGNPFKVFYLNADSMLPHHDVQIFSKSGEKFAFSRCLLAAISDVLYNVFKDLYACPLANADDVISVSTDITSEELQSMTDFFLEGKLPTVPTSGCVDSNARSVFKAFGFNLDSLNSTTGEDGGGNFLTQREPPDENICKQEMEVAEEYDEDDPDYYDDGNYQNYGDESDEDYAEDKDNVLLEPVVKNGKRKASAKNGAGTAKRARRSGVKSEGGKAKTGAPAVNASEGKDTYFYFPQEGERDLSLPFQCERCIRGFKKVDAYRQHFHRHELGTEDYSKAYICTRCEKFYADSAKTVGKHGKDECTVKRHDDIESMFTYFCAKCDPGRTFATIYKLRAHALEVHNDKLTCYVTSAVCPACGMGCDSLKRHKLRYGPYHVGKCAFCAKEFETWEEHKRHLDTRHGGRFRHVCGLCGVCSFDTEAECKHHRMFCKFSKALGPVQACDPGQVACTMCAEVVQATPAKVKQHMKECHVEKQIKCGVCGDVFFQQNYLEQHMATIHASEELACGMCDKVYPSKYRLRVHQLTHQYGQDNKPFKCDECDMSFTMKGFLTQHKKSRHDPLVKALNAKKHMCQICGKSMREDSLRDHMRSAHGEDHIKCTQCDSTFKHEKIYLKHVKNQHTFVTCELCGKQFSNSAYKKHKRKDHTVPSKMRFYCQSCDKGFILTSQYQDHMNIHTGERPHVCKYCTKTFSDRNNRLKHMRESHSEQYQAAKLAKQQQR